MPSGLPDYFKETRPRFGGAQRKHDEVTVLADDETELITVEGKGMIYLGVVLVDHTTTQAMGVVRLYIDDELIADLTFEHMVKFGIDEARCHPVYLRKFNDVDYVYSVALTWGITFESSFKINYREFDGTIPTVNYQVIYALI